MDLEFEQKRMDLFNKQSYSMSEKNTRRNQLLENCKEALHNKEKKYKTKVEIIRCNSLSKNMPMADSIESNLKSITNRSNVNAS